MVKNKTSLILQSGWSQKFSDKFRLPKYGCIVTPSSLTNGRGAACVNWAII